MGGPLNLFAVLDQTAARRGDRGAVYLGQRLVQTWSELRDSALRIASSLRETGAPGDRIAVASENRPEIVELMFAIWAAERVFVPINYKLHVLEMQQILDDSGAALVFASPKIAQALTPITDVPVEALTSPEYQNRSAATPSERPRDTDPGALAWLFCTSGTTGRSKGAMLSHRNLTAITVAHLADFDDPNQDCSLVHGAPMSHGSGLYVPPHVLRGARQVIPESAAFEPDEFLDLCDHHPGSRGFLAPTMVQRLVETGRPRPDNLRSIVYGGGPMYVDSMKKALDAFGPIFVQVYGQGEAPMTITGLRRADHVDADDAVLGSVGYARSAVDVAVVCADGTPLGPNEIGEIVCRGDVVMSRYWKITDATAEALKDGWLHTRRHGFLRRRRLPDVARPVQGRGDQRRQQPLPARGQEVLLEHSDVVEACVVGTPDPDRGEIVVAFIVGTAAEPDLEALLLERIARFKRPKCYLYVDELPKNSYGKVLRRELRDRLALTSVAFLAAAAG